MNDKRAAGKMPWFSHPANFSNDLPAKVIRSKFGLVGEAWYWRLMQDLRNSPDYKLPSDNDTYASYAEDWSIDTQKVQQFIKVLVDKGLLNMNGSAFYSPSIMEDMDAMQRNIDNKRMAGMLGAEKRWGEPPKVINDKDKPPRTEKIRRTPESEYIEEKLNTSLNSQPGGVMYAMHFLKRTLWPANNMTMDTQTYDVLHSALSVDKVPVNIVAIAIDKLINYSPRVTKPSSYLKSIMEDKLEKARHGKK